MKKTLLFLLTMLLFYSCNKTVVSEEPDPPILIQAGSYLIRVDDDSSLLLGTWKLDSLIVVDREREFFTNAVVYDYTLDSAVFEFKPNHTLTVVVETDQIYKGLKPDTYSYLLETSIWSAPTNSQHLYINDTSYPVDRISVDMMRFYISSYSGVIYYFLVKIE